MVPTPVGSRLLSLSLINRAGAVAQESLPRDFARTSDALPAAPQPAPWPNQASPGRRCSSSHFDCLFSTRFFDYEIKPVYLRASPMADVNDKKLIALVRAAMDATKTGCWRVTERTQTTQA
jgi:hypothetical protein